MKVVFFRIPKPKQFTYPPRYYDEEKERVEQRKRELGISTDGKTDFKSQVGNSWRRLRKSNKSRQKKASMSALIYLMIVAMLVYFIFFA